MLFCSALSLAYSDSFFSAVSENGGLQYIIYLIPHGIFEITGTVILIAAQILRSLYISIRLMISFSSVVMFFTNITLA
ncbi:hypothetical protein [Methanobrevibacter sp.]